MSEEKVIRLKPDKKDFEEIYFSGNQGSLLFSPTTKGKTIATIFFGCILLIVFCFKDKLSQENFGILYFLSFIFLLCTVYLSVSINKVTQWKKSVNIYLNTLENCNLYEIRFNHEFFNVNLGNQEENSQWEEFERFDINDRFISLEGKYNYMFPKKSMTEKDYNVLKKSIKENIKE